MDPFTWLEERRPPAPAPLLAAMRSELERFQAGERDALSDRLANTALSTLAEVADGAGGRPEASRLLAVDALLTYAFEAAAEAGPATLTALVQRLGAGRFESLLEGRAA
ncbi:MAG TPA: hypothetical protein VK966_14020 [Longimicrobiales bacterium]|nr:hypothetical protein [Longimicrobiales bacterium]